MKTRVLRRNGGLVTAVAGVTVLACGGAPPATQSLPPQPEDEGLPRGHPVMEAPTIVDAEETASGFGSLAGSVAELLVSGGYTYVRLELEGGDAVWVAGPETPLEVGQELTLPGATRMGPFTSPTLERTFDDLYFVGEFQAPGPPPDASVGEALEVLVGGGYTYVRTRVDGEDQWFAGPQIEVAEGDEILWAGGMRMGEFTSPTLGRTFEDIVFVSRFWIRR